MNFWQTKVIGDLKAYKDKTRSVNNLEERIAEIKDRCGSVGAFKYGKERISSGTPHNPADQWLNDLVLQEELEKQLRAVRTEIYTIEQILGMLEEDERIVLASFFINRNSHYIDKLIDTLHLEKSSIYRLKDKALEHYTLVAYGITSYK